MHAAYAQTRSEITKKGDSDEEDEEHGEGHGARKEASREAAARAAAKANAAAGRKEEVCAHPVVCEVLREGAPKGKGWTGL